MNEWKETIEMTLCQNNKSGIVSIIGEPNAGKSTLLNAIIGKKVSIVSSKVQTTRRQVRGILERDNTQVVFIDTPGFFNPRSSLEKALVDNFKTGYKDADLVLLVIDASARSVSSSLSFLNKLATTRLTFSVILNKVDIASKSQILEIASACTKFEFVERVFMLSATQRDGVSELVDYIISKMPEGHWLYEENTETDMPLSFRLSEITREKLFNELRQELPYNIYVETESIKEGKSKALIHQSIIVLKDSQKGIILGKGGSMIKKIKELAIRDMKDILNKKIELKLFVKVKEKWTEKRSHLQNAGILDV